MKRKHFKQISILLLAAILVTGIGTVPSESTKQAYAAGSKKMKLNHSSVTMQAGTKRTIKLTKNKPSGTVKWSSSNKKVAVVSKKGVVTGKKKGMSVITAKKGKKSAKCTVKVFHAKVSSFPLSKGKNGKSPTITLNSGYKMPVLGLGTYSLEDEVCVNSVTAALKAGVRKIDTAYIYDNEESVGEGIRKSGVPREEIFVTTKLYMDQYDNAEKAIDDALKRLDLEYIDGRDIIGTNQRKPSKIKGLQMI